LENQHKTQTNKQNKN